MIRAGLRVTEQGKSTATGELIVRCKLHERSAQTEFYERYRNEVARTVYKVLGPDAEIEDVIQDVFIEVFRSIDKFKGRSKVTTWLYRVSVNVALQRLRKRKRGPELFPQFREDIPDHETPQRVLERQESKRVVYQVLDTMAEKKRAVFILHEILGLDSKEIARVVNANVLTVRTRLHYARKEFYSKMLETDLFDGGAA
jgi:RNA polymerase sigma-70 factor (ECF subfamily)